MQLPHFFIFFYSHLFTLVRPYITPAFMAVPVQRILQVDPSNSFVHLSYSATVQKYIQEHMYNGQLAIVAIETGTKLELDIS